MTSAFLPSTIGRFIVAGFLLTSISVHGQGRVDRIEVPAVIGSRVYTNASVISVTEQGVKIAHDSGIAILAFEHLPEAWREKYGPPARQTLAVTAPSVSTPVPTPVTTPGVAAPTVSSSGSFDPQHLVFIKTDKGTGSGFIARANGAVYVYTNAHVLCGEPGSFSTKIESVTTASGKSIPIPQELEMSDTSNPNSPNGLEDIARFPIKLEDSSSVYEIGNSGAVPMMNQQVVAYGNSLGGNVITSLEGMIVGVGSDRVEINCQIVPGNSGGPVVLSGGRSILGISTYLVNGKRDIWAKGTTFEGVRRFALRPEQVTKWRRMSTTALLSAMEELASFDRDTLSLAAACFLNPTANRGGFVAPSTKKGDYIIKEVIVTGSKGRLGAAISNGIARVNQRLGSAVATRSMTTAVPVFQEFFATIAQASAAQAQSMKTSDRSPYLKQYIPAMLEIRKVVQDEFIRQGALRYR